MTRQLFCSTTPAHNPHIHSFPTRRSSDLIWNSADSAGQFSKSSCTSRKLSNGAMKILLVEDETKMAQLIRDRKSTRLNSSHVSISYAVFCLKKKKKSNNNM